MKKRKSFTERLKKMYRVYVLKRRKGGSEILHDTKTNTGSAAIAAAAFKELRERQDFEGKNYILLMTHNHTKLNVHLFNAKPGDEAYFDLDNPVRLEA